MSRSMPADRDVRTLGYVLRRTNYAEADRILNLITPMGKITAIAKGVRREKSKLAGGIEMFSLSDFNIHRGRSEFGIVTGAKMKRYYGEIVKDLTRMEVAAMILRRVSIAAESSDSVEYFELVDKGLAGLDDGAEVELVEAWFLLNLARIMGEEVNLYRDASGAKLVSDGRYVWDNMEGALAVSEQGEYGADEIKMLRLMLTNDLNVVRRVKTDIGLLTRALSVARAVSKM